MVTNKEKKIGWIQSILAFIKKYKMIMIVLALLIVLALIIGRIITRAQENKVMSFLEGKTFVIDFYSATAGKGGDKHLVSVQNGKVSFERWYDFKNVPSGDIDQFMDCRVKARLFSDDIAIQAKNGGHWSTVQLVALQDDNTVVNYTYSADSPIWREVTKEEVEKERTIFFCRDHQFSAWKEVSVATCTHNGEKVHTCTKCGYSEKEYTAKREHIYEGKKCTLCGLEKQPEKANIDPNTWYTYNNGVLHIQNCLVKSAFAVSQGNAMSVQYYAVCQHCHAIDESSKLAGPEVNYEVKKIHYCDACGGQTIVRIKID